MNDFRITFSATAPRSLDPDVGERLAAALAEMPGTGRVEGAWDDGEARSVSATFWIRVRLGMADAARDGSRLAKEALKASDLGEARLVELSVSRRGGAGPGEGVGSD